MKSLPIKLFIAYILFTLAVSFIGPMKYNNYDKVSVFIYIISFLICLIFGYTIANRYKIVLRKRQDISNEKISVITSKNHYKIIRFVSISIMIAFLSIFMEFIEIVIKNPSAFMITNMARNYIEVNGEHLNYSLPILFRFLTGFFRNVSIILGIYYWRNIKKRYKVILVFFLLFLILVNMIAYGTQKFIGDLIIYLVIVLSIKMLDSNNKIKLRKIIFISLFFIILAIALFSFVQAQRYEMIGITVENYGIKSGGLQYFDSNNFIFKIFGDKLGLGLAILLTGYLSSGYYGLSLCLKLPFEWTYGIGSSYFMSKLISVIFNTRNMYEKTYLNRMTEVFGRDGLRTWNTIFPWLASDFTFFGALLIFVLVGYIWQISWLEILNYRNPVSIVLFATISLGLIYVPANNQLFQGIDTYVATTFTILYWLLKHKKYNFRI
ncbi:hypothetical protein [Thermoanaerobacterium butyriciformans]|uniref:Oligosaccharide repeat unit polymerase n=1 Tax=Thermoanaerobacterium butyriciformans TaxID=1702242 RepID=A0ABS4NAP0_9THEO|nr:hypothetical protein [Thermoanaerobacterium butyriciformans]MBP2070685.1 hypothetical protein [Thermoanaerobacterium butyriciformans]